MRKSKNETVMEFKIFKTAGYIVRSTFIVVRETHAQKRPQETLSLHTWLISKDLPLNGETQQILGIVVFYQMATLLQKIRGHTMK